MSRIEDRARGAVAAMDNHAFGSLPEHFAPDCDFRMNGQRMDMTVMAEMISGWYAAFPDLVHTIGAYVEQGDRAGYEVRVTGTHTAPMQTPNGPIPATGKKVAFDAIDSIQVGPDGRAVMWHVYFDMVGVLEQLGIA